MPWLINPQQLDNFRKNQKNLVIIDASWHLPSDQRDAKAEFIDEHILDAQFFDINSFNDPAFPLQNRVILDAAIISEKLGSLGIRNDSKIIIYDNSPLHTSCRALWMMKLFGHPSQQLYILNGGFPAWKKYGGKLATGETTKSAKPYDVNIQRQWLCDLKQMKDNINHPTAQVIDARHPVRFAGGPEPRPDLRSGHIPGSFCFPYFTMFDATGSFAPLEKIRNQLTDLGIDLDTHIITSCGSAITAPIINFVLDLMNIEQQSVYNGSWVEWASRTLYPDEESLTERPVATCLD